jgi:hypothetical protein
MPPLEAWLTKCVTVSGNRRSSGLVKNRIMLQVIRTLLELGD